MITDAQRSVLALVTTALKLLNFTCAKVLYRLTLSNMVLDLGKYLGISVGSHPRIDLGVCRPRFLRTRSILGSRSPWPIVWRMQLPRR